MAKRRKAGVTLAVLLAACVVMAAAWVFVVTRRGEQWINPRARVNPKKAYTVLLWEYQWPSAPGGVVYPLWLEGVLTRFRSRFPNVEVRVEWLQAEEAGQRLEKALAEGSPPDLFAAGPDTLAVYDEKRQVPASFYMTKAEKEAYLPASVAMLTRGPGDDIVWGWPRWVAVHAWLAGPAARQGARVVVARPAMGAFLDLMALAGHPSPFSSEGAFLGNEAAVRPVLAFLQEKGRLQPGEGLGLMRLLSGKAGYVMGATPWAITRVSSVPGKGLYPVMPDAGGAGMPEPVRGGGVRGSGGAILMFRRPGVSHDHLRAVAEVARFLSRSGFHWARPEGPIIPVISERAVQTRDGVSHEPIVVTYAGFAAEAAGKVVTPHIKPYHLLKSEKEYQATVLAPLLEALVEGRITVEEAARRMSGSKAGRQGT